MYHIIRTPFSSSTRRPSSTGSDSSATVTVSGCSAHITTPVFKVFTHRWYTTFYSI